MQIATNLIDSIDYRKQSLLKVGKHLAQVQQPFFLQGPKHLKPYHMHTFASEVGIVPSTLSRIVNQKYIQTPWGMFSLRLFFSSAIQAKPHSHKPLPLAANEKTASNLIKLLIKNIVSKNKGKKLSDQKITDLLQAQGHQLSRRTIAKYRKQLNILSSFYR